MGTTIREFVCDSLADAVLSSVVFTKGAGRGAASADSLLLVHWEAISLERGVGLGGRCMG